MLKKILLYIFVPLLTAFMGCDNDHSTKHQSRQGDTIYTQEAVLTTYGTNPQRALLLLDSAVIAGNVNDFDAELLRAVIYGRSLNDQRKDSAIIMCETLLEHDSVRTNEPSTIKNRLEVLSLLTDLYRSKGYNEQWLKYAIELAEMNRKTGDDVEALRCEADIATVMANLGEGREALAKLDSVIGALDGPRSVSRLDGSIIAMKRKINTLERMDDYDGIIKTSKRILGKLDDFEKNQNLYTEDNQRMPPGAGDRPRYIDFYRGQAYAFMAKAYAYSQRDSARLFLRQFDKTDYAQTASGQRMTASTRIMLGDFDKALSMHEQTLREMGADTFNGAYATILHDYAIMEEQKGHLDKALEYQKRFANMQEALSDSLILSEAHHYAARYHLQEQQMKIQQVEAEKQQMSIILISVAIIALLGTGYSIWQFRQKRLIDKKNKSLARQISENIAFKNKYEALRNKMDNQHRTPEINKETAGDAAKVQTKDMSDEELFKFLRQTIKQEQLFLDPNLDRSKIGRMFLLSNKRVGSAFAQGSEYSSLADFIRDCRLDYSCQLLVMYPDLSIKEVASKSGFNYASTFSTDFKNKFSLSPTQYRRMQTPEATILDS